MNMRNAETPLVKVPKFNIAIAIDPRSHRYYYPLLSTHSV